MRPPTPEAWPQTAPWQSLLAQIVPAIHAIALELPEPTIPLHARVGPTRGQPTLLVDGGLLLDEALLGPALHHPADATWAERAPVGCAPLALDRWRRATGGVLEAGILASLAEQLGEAVLGQWWALGWAAELVDRAAPALGWLWPAAVDLLTRSHEGLDALPRASAWLFRWRREQGVPLAPEAVADLPLSDWADFFSWIRDPNHGPGARAPLPLEVGSPRAIGPWQAPPRAALPTRIEAPLSGLRLKLEGTSPAFIRGKTAYAAGEIDTVLLVAPEGGKVDLQARPAGPVGRWAVVAGSIPSRIYAARGIEVELRADGRAEVVLADAFVGPPTDDAIDMARRMGASGSGHGRWRVSSLTEGGGELCFDKLVLDDVTVHPRLTGGFALPADAWLGPVKRVLEAMAGARFQWRQEGARLLLTGRVAGMPVEIEARPANS